MAGNIEPRGPGKWRLRVSAGTDPVTGLRNVVRVPFEGTRDEAELELARLLVGVVDGGAGVGTTKTVGYLFDQWLPVAELAERTRYNYRRSVELHLRPQLGGKQLRKLSTFDIDSAYVRLRMRGATVDQIRYAHAVLSSALSQAIAWGWITANPARNARKPPEPERDVAVPTPAEVRKLVAATGGLSDEDSPDALGRFRTAVAIHIADHLGARCGEICGLQWPDIDWNASTIRVARTVDVVPGVGEVVKKIKGNAKRHKTPRPVDAGTLEVLHLWDIVTAGERVDNPDQWVFQAPRKLSFYRPSMMGSDFKALAVEAGLPELHMHSLRHYVVTRLRDAGVDIDVISRRVGHSRTSTTHDRYGDEVPESARQAADIIAAINRGDI